MNEFFNPADEKADYSENINYFAPIAAALSPGQRSALEYISFRVLLKVGADSRSVTEADIPSADSIFTDAEGNVKESISIYSGMNRAIFRKGVALTDDALMQKNLGKDPYEKLWEEGGIIDITAYVTVGVGAIALVIGSVFAYAAETAVPSFTIKEKRNSRSIIGCEIHRSGRLITR